MIRANLNVQPRWETVTAGDKSIDLLMKPMPRLAKLQAASMLGSNFAGAVGQVMDQTILDWREVYDEGDPPATIPFSRAGLDILLGLEDELANAVQDRVFEANGMGDKTASDPTQRAAKPSGPTLPPSSTPAS
jgi:hypothetical protein